VYLWTVVEALKYPAYFSWVLWCSLLVIGFQGFFYRVHRSQVLANNVEFVIVSIGSRNVRCSLFETIKHTALSFPQVPLYVVVEQDSELLGELENLITSDYLIPIRDAIATYTTTLRSSSKPMIEIVAVPKKYRPDLIAKGRAINYFIENYVVTSKWYTFLDDDDLILDDNFLYEISYYGPRGYVACNPILTTRKGKSNLTYVMDNMRIFDDFSIFRLFTGLLHTPLLGLHGEALTVKGSVLKVIGYGRRTITEDFSFAREIIKGKKTYKDMKTWQSSTRVSIRSANRVHDLLRQRARWFKGIFLDLEDSPTSMKIITGARMALWTVSIFGSWALSPLWSYWLNANIWFYLFFIGGVTPWLVFIVLILKKRRSQPWYFILFVPIYGIIESLTPWFALVHERKNCSFYVIDKN
jgi:hypothetical protein